ncbi:MAG: hypothetical protein ACTSYR_03900 [Candidatus Odinarchaeia archaeon]
MVLRELVEFLKKDFSDELMGLVDFPEGCIENENFIYRLSGRTHKLQKTSGCSINDFGDVKKIFSHYFTGNLKLGYRSADSENYDSVRLRPILAGIYFLSPLEKFARVKDFNYTGGIKVDWFLGMIKLGNEVVFLYLNFINPKFKAIFRASIFKKSDVLDFNILERFVSRRFKKFLKKILLLENEKLDWFKITEVDLHHQVIIKSLNGSISEEITTVN